MTSRKIIREKFTEKVALETILLNEPCKIMKVKRREDLNTEQMSNMSTAAEKSRGKRLEKVGLRVTIL